MCDCIKKIEHSDVWKSEKKGAPVSVKVETVVSLLKDKTTRVTKSHVEIKYSGSVRPVKRVIDHSFCPFCGEKYPSESSYPAF